MITLDKRLEACSKMVKGTGIVCDIGTDHAYLPAYLIENNICKKAVASDINEGPLKFAEQTLEKYGCKDSISLNKSDGLEGIDLTDVSDIIIAGMGGETIAKILSDERTKRKDLNFVLQPMTRASHLRKWLYQNGFEIVKEIAVSEDRFVYTAINAVYTGVVIDLGLTTQMIGRVNTLTEDGEKYCKAQYNKMNNIALGLSKAGKTEDSDYYKSIAERLDIILKGKMNMVSKIYDFINSIAPFSTQEKWDNSGLITGDMTRKVSRALVCLDITGEVAQEAAEKGAELVISHHPVIFHPLYSLPQDEPVCYLWKNGISAICVHTPYDCAEGGMSDVLMELTGFKKTEGILEVVGNREKPYGFGTVGELAEVCSAKELGERLRDALHTNVIKYNDSGKAIKKAAFCTGSGGNLIEAAANTGADAYITSEVKHDQWLYAKRRGISVFDCGHYHTEIIGMERLCKRLTAEFPDIEFVMSETDTDPVEYIV